MNDLLRERAVWGSIVSKDAFVRRGTCRLLVRSLDRYPQSLDPSMLSTGFLVEGLHEDQIGSAIDFMNAIIHLSVIYPHVWTSNYQGSGRKSASSRLLHFLRKGSQGSTPEFWDLLTTLFITLENNRILFGASDAIFRCNDLAGESNSTQILAAVRTGLVSKNEPRSNSFAGWRAYLEIYKIIVAHEESPQVQTLLRNCLMPLVKHYIKPSPDSVEWAISGSQQQELCARASFEVFKLRPEFFNEEWHGLSAAFIEDLQTLLPEQAKGYSRSQDLLAERARRWYQIHKDLLNTKISGSLNGAITKTLAQEIMAAVTVLKNRGGKPYGAAAALQAALGAVPTFILGDAKSREVLTNFAKTDIPHLIISPSTSYLLSILDYLSDLVDIGSILQTSLESLTLPNSATGEEAMKAVLAAPGIAKAGYLTLRDNILLQDLVERSLAVNKESDWDLLAAAVSNPAAPQEFKDDLMSRLMAALSMQNQEAAGVHGLERAASFDRGLIRSLAHQSEGSTFLKRLLVLSDSSDAEIARSARNLAAIVEESVVSGFHEPKRLPILTIINREMDNVSSQSLRYAVLLSAFRSC